MTAHHKNFYAGKYQDILNETVDSASFEWTLAQIPIIIGSLSFVGRLDEATALSRKSLASLSVIAQIEARFYLAVAYCRHNHGADSRKYLIENLRVLDHPIAASNGANVHLEVAKLGQTIVVLQQKPIDVPFTVCRQVERTVFEQLLFPK